MSRTPKDESANYIGKGKAKRLLRGRGGRGGRGGRRGRGGL